MRLINKLSLSFIFLTATFSIAIAENSTISPYSRFGYGILQDKANTAQKAMGGVGIAMRSGKQINFMNPASYAAIDSLTFLFDMGVDLKVARTSDGDEHGSHTTGGLNYITMQAPLTKWCAASLGLMPYSEVGYNFGKTMTTGENSRSGSGGINELYLGFGFKPVKGLTAGLNLSYLFGTTVNESYLTYQSTTTLFERRVEVRDFNLRLGIQYGAEIAKDHIITVGAIFQPKKSFHGHTYGISYDVNNDTSPDTIAINLKGNADMAETWGLGINYQWEQKLMAEINFTYQPWSKCKFARIEEFDNNRGFNDRWKLNAGAQYIAKSRGTWLQRINYRVGCYYSQDYLKVGDNSVREYGASIGFGLPAPTSKTLINLAFEYRHRQAHPSPLVKEDYLVVTLGVNFNELWFWRNKIR